MGPMLLKMMWEGTFRLKQEFLFFFYKVELLIDFYVFIHYHFYKILGEKK